MPQVGTSVGFPLRDIYDCGEFDFGGGAAATFRLAGPKGARGKIKEIIAAVSEVFLTVTTNGTVAVGTPADADAYALMTIPSGTAVNSVFYGADGYGDDPDAIIADIPEDKNVVVTLTNGTGASITGIASIRVVIDWM